MKDKIICILFVFIFISSLNAQDFVTQSPGVLDIKYGAMVEGELALGDKRCSTGALCDIFTFEGLKNDRIILDLTAMAFDTYLKVKTPRGNWLENDDHLGLKSQSHIEFVLPEEGVYEIMASAYNRNEQGTYVLSLKQGNPSPDATQLEGRIFGLFVGISDYNGRAPNLEFTANDALSVRNALIEGTSMRFEDTLVLTNENATAQQFQLALGKFRQEVGPKDTFIFFFSGHGERYQRERIEQSDPDGFDESLELVDQTILDNELDILLGQINGRAQLIIIDACYSGGFAKDVISKPNRMGLFSSEEDLTSMVAAKFKAGGFLAHFFVDAIRYGQADVNQDELISALELSDYLARRYMREYTQDSSQNQNTLGFQKLIIDRGSIDPYYPLFIKNNYYKNRPTNEGKSGADF